MARVLTGAVGTVRTHAFRRGVLEDEGFPVAEITDRLTRPDVLVWVDVVDAGPDDLRPLADELGLHDLAVEDAVEPHQRPKVDRYPTHLFVTWKVVDLDPDRRRLVTAEVDAFVGDRWVVTAREPGAGSTEAALRGWSARPELVALGPGALVHGLLDQAVDGYMDVLDRIEDALDDVADEIFSGRPLPPDRQREWFDMRRAVTRLHRLVLPLREALSTLLHREHELVQPALLPYWQDLYDHVVTVTEATDGLRDLCASLSDADLSLRDYRQNQVMKTVSSWAAIIAVPTLVTGVYGMNVPFPGEGEVHGVVTALALIVAASVGLYVLFRRRGWL